MLTGALNKASSRWYNIGMFTIFVRGTPISSKTLIKLVFWFILATVMTYGFITTEHTIEIRPEVVPAPEYDRFMAQVTAYTSSVEETDDTPFISADGNHVYDGLIACPRRIPFGTPVIIEGREYKCGDRMHPRFDHRFDIWVATKAEAYEWGVREVVVAIPKKFSTGID